MGPRKAPETPATSLGFIRPIATVFELELAPEVGIIGEVPSDGALRLLGCG